QGARLVPAGELRHTLRGGRAAAHAPRARSRRRGSRRGQRRRQLAQAHAAGRLRWRDRRRSRRCRTMRITDMIRFAAERGEPVFSFKFFPPKNDAGVHALFESLHSLRPLGPSFVSVTWGAGGSTRGRTLEMVTRIKKETEIEAMAHLTCVGVSKKELEEQLAV